MAFLLGVGWECIKGEDGRRDTDEAAGGIMLDSGGGGSAWSPQGLACSGHSLGLAG